MAVEADSKKLTALRARLKMIEQDLAELKAQLAHAEAADSGVAMAELYGAWGGRLNAGEQDFQAVEFSMKWLDEPGA